MNTNMHSTFVDLQQAGWTMITKLIWKWTQFIPMAQKEKKKRNVSIGHGRAYKRVLVGYFLYYFLPKNAQQDTESTQQYWQNERLHVLLPNVLSTQQVTSHSPKCPHFSTFATKLKIFGWMNRQDIPMFQVYELFLLFISFISLLANYNCEWTALFSFVPVYR